MYEDRPFKEKDKVCCLSRIEETEGRKTYIIFFLNKKPKVPNMKDIKVKIQYCLLEITEVVLESKIFKIRDTFRSTYDWLILFSS